MTTASDEPGRVRLAVLAALSTQLLAVAVVWNAWRLIELPGWGADGLNFGTGEGRHEWLALPAALTAFALWVLSGYVASRLARTSVGWWMMLALPLVIQCVLGMAGSP